MYICLVKKHKKMAKDNTNSDNSGSGQNVQKPQPEKPRDERPRVNTSTQLEEKSWKPDYDKK